MAREYSGTPSSRIGRTKRIATPAADLPQTLEEAGLLVHLIGVAARTLDAQTAARDGAVAKLVADHAPGIEASAADVKKMVAKLQAYAEANKTALLADGARSVQLASGAFGWRYGNPTVKLDADTDEAAAIETLKRARLGAFVRTVEELNKQAILDAPDKIADLRGLSVEQAESFFVRPLEVKDAIAGKAAKLKGAALQKPDAPEPKPKKSKKQET